MEEVNSGLSIYLTQVPLPPLRLLPYIFPPGTRQYRRHLRQPTRAVYLQRRSNSCVNVQLMAL